MSTARAPLGLIHNASIVNTVANRKKRRKRRGEENYQRPTRVTPTATSCTGLLLLLISTPTVLLLQPSEQVGIVLVLSLRYKLSLD
jgi:hypothetical protein